MNAPFSRDFPIKLRIENNLNHRVAFPTFDMIRVLFRDSAGKVFGGGTARTMTTFTAPLIIKRKETAAWIETAKFSSKEGRAPILFIFDGTGSSQEITPLKPGRYFLRFMLATSADAARKAGSFFHHPLMPDVPVWSGHAETKEVAFDLVSAH